VPVRRLATDSDCMAPWNSARWRRRLCEQSQVSTDQTDHPRSDDLTAHWLTTRHDMQRPQPQASTDVQQGGIREPCVSSWQLPIHFFRHFCRRMYRSATEHTETRNSFTTFLVDFRCVCSYFVTGQRAEIAPVFARRPLFFYLQAS